MSYYITTTLPYVNAEPHIGFALEIVRADVLARLHRFLGEAVWFNTGVDEHGLKIYRKAMEQNLTPQAYCDLMAQKFVQLKTTLDLSWDSFTRTTDPAHQAAAQEFWRRCLRAGDIYKQNYQVKYCVGCELAKTDSELERGRCPVHPNQELETIVEENYFFRFSKYQEALLKLYQDNPSMVIPAGRQKEISKFIATGPKDFSISRLKSKMPWGVPVPDDPEQVMYVWFDALVNYVSCLNWPFDSLRQNSGQAAQGKPEGEEFERFWPGTQICGKDNLRQQAAMWQAMLLACGLPTSRQIIVNGFITADGQKMSKSLNNTVDPEALVKTYGTDAVRYYLLAELQPFEDSDYTEVKFKTRYQADLANGLGNLVSRVAALLEKNHLNLELDFAPNQKLLDQIKQSLEQGLYNEALAILWKELRTADENLSQRQPWAMIDQEELRDCLEPVTQSIVDVAVLLQIFLPQTANKIINLFSQKPVVKPDPLFSRV